MKHSEAVVINFINRDVENDDYIFIFMPILGLTVVYATFVL